MAVDAAHDMLSVVPDIVGSATEVIVGFEFTTAAEELEMVVPTGFVAVTV